MKKIIAAVLLVLLCTAVLGTAMAADVFAYAEKSIVIFEGEEAYPEITQDGKFAEGEIVYSSGNKKVVTVDENGTLTAVAPGKTQVKATLKQNGKNVKAATIQVQVARRVTKVTLSTKNLTVYEPDDETILPLLRPRDEDEEPLGDRVIVIAAGKAARLTVTCTPENATNRKVAYETTDAGIAKIQNVQELKGVQAGECDLVISSVQNPEIQERFHVLVIQPVKKITIDAPFKTLAAGSSMALDAICAPEDASIQSVVWTSRSPKIAEVDESGMVTGIAKGRVVIDATAADGSGIKGSITLTVTQDVTEISFKQADAKVSVGRTVQLGVNVLPKNADNKQVTWSSTDDTIATVNKSGVVTGKKAGECLIVAASKSNPDVSAAIQVTVVQPVTKISFLTPAGVSIPVNTGYQLEWQVSPDDATITDVTFKSSSTKVATVDDNGFVTGLSRGTATITATAADGSRKTGTYKITVFQPVEGVSLPQEVYYVQRFYPNRDNQTMRTTEIKADILPANANNQRVYWAIEDPYVAAATSVEANVGALTGGYVQGGTTVTVTTEDGGFTATAAVLVDDFDGMISVEGAWLVNNQFQMSLRNVGAYTLKNIRFRIECFDTQGNPLVCNQNHFSYFFDGSYNYALLPEGRAYNRFSMEKYLDTGTMGYFCVTITGFEFENGQVWEIPETDRTTNQSLYSEYMGQPTPTPAPTLVNNDSYWETPTPAPEEGDESNG